MSALIAPPLHILIFAAGASRRMQGRDKLMETVEGQPLLRKLACASIGTGLPVTVALPPDRPARTEALRGLALSTITVENPQEGMSASLTAGLTALPDGVAIMVLLADLPEIDLQDLQTMAKAQGKTPDLIVRATSQSGVPGHPVVFPPWARGALAAMSGDEGARALLRDQRDKVCLIALAGDHATTDLDTPEDWAKWQAKQGVSGGQ